MGGLPVERRGRGVVCGEVCLPLIRCTRSQFGSPCAGGGVTTLPCRPLSTLQRSSMLHGAMRQAEESKLGRERYGAAESAGQNITRGARH